MKALVAYDNYVDKWVLISISTIPKLALSPESFKKRLTKEGLATIANVIEVDILKLKCGDGESYSLELKEDPPEMPNLHQRIKANKAKLEEYLKRWKV